MDEVARDVLGCVLRLGAIQLAITEVEAYGGPEDSASHARFGPTKRNAVMWGPAGRTYVYLCYGVHNMLNIVTGEDGEASAVLVRSCAPVAGAAEVARRRGGRKDPSSLAGPGKVAQALGIDTAWSGRPLYLAGELWLRAPRTRPSILHGPRVGIAFARARDRTRLRRFAVADSPWVSHRTGLKAARRA